MESSQKYDYKIYMVTRDPFDPVEESPIYETNEEGYYIVQFVKPLRYDEQKRLKKMYGLRLTDYLPNFAFLEWLKPATLKALTKDRLYRASARYQNRDKISPLIYTSSEASNPTHLLRAVLHSDEGESGFYHVINFIAEQNNQVLSEKAQEGDDDDSTGVVHVYELTTRADAEERGESKVNQIRVMDDRNIGGNLQVVFPFVPGDVLLKIAQLKEVRWIEEVARIKLDAAAIREGTPAGLIQSGTVGDTPVWNKGIHGEGQVIGVTDTLVLTDHCMFRDPNHTPIGPGHSKIEGNRQRQETYDGHGHAVAALAAGFSFVVPSVNINKGMAWAARLSLDGSRRIEGGLGSLFSILNNQAGDKAFIHSNSWHERVSTYTQVAFEVDNFVSENEEHFVCGASGNNDEEFGAPGIAKNALCVSASSNPPNQLQVSDGNTFPINNRDLRRKPEICAPACGLFTAAGSECDASSLANCVSSWATPIIAGAAALVRQYYMEGWCPSGTKKVADGFQHPSGALIKATLLNSTVNMSKGAGYPGDRAGWGLVRLANTLFFAEEGTPKLFVRDISNAMGLRMGDSHTFPLTVKDDTRPLKITLVWSDSPALPAASTLLVNDLDLIVTSPDGKTFLGNNFDMDGLSVESTNMNPNKTDTINNVEMVIRERPLQGTWTITVHCTAANGETKIQGYALVATAALV